MFYWPLTAPPHWVEWAPSKHGQLPGQPRQALHTLASRRCFLDTLWFFGFTDNLCLAALLSRQAMARGMASRLTLSMVPAEEKCLFGRDGFIGATCMERKPHSPDENRMRGVPEPSSLLDGACMLPGPAQGRLRAGGAHWDSEMSMALGSKRGH